MNRDTVRSVGIFSAVIVVLGALVLGGVYFAKARHESYSPQQQEVAQNQPEQQQPTPEENSQNQTEQNPPAEEAAPSEAENQNQPEQTTTPPNEGEGAAAEDQAEAAQEPAQEQTTTPATGTVSEVPETGAEDIVWTAAIVMLVVYLAVSVKRSRARLERGLLS